MAKKTRCIGIINCPDTDTARHAGLNDARDRHPATGRGEQP